MSREIIFSISFDFLHFDTFIFREKISWKNKKKYFFFFHGVKIIQKPSIFCFYFLTIFFSRR